jgi:hypothetical protein
MNMTGGKPTSVNNYSLTYSTNWNDHFVFLGYTFIKLLGKHGVTGMNISTTSSFIGADMAMYGQSYTFFYMRPLNTKTKIKFTPEVFVLSSPYSYMVMPDSKSFGTNSDIGFMVGNSFDIPLSKRFRVNFNIKNTLSTNPSSPKLIFLTIGSKFSL